jgi:hypothetical protein
MIVMPVERRPGVEIARLAPPEERDRTLSVPEPEIADVMNSDA